MICSLFTLFGSPVTLSFLHSFKTCKKTQKKLGSEKIEITKILKSSKEKVKIRFFERCIYPTPGCDTKSFFKHSSTDFKSVFSYSTSCHTKVKEPCLPYYLPIVFRENIWIYVFPESISII